MKKGILTTLIASILISNPISFHLQQYSGSLKQTTITGKISPAEAAEVVWIVRAKDTLKTPIKWGSFSQQVKRGKYKLIINAKAPYKNASLGNLEVKENHVLNGRVDSSEMIVAMYTSLNRPVY
jgi:hypothetical protein